MNKILRTALALLAGAVFLTAGYQTVVHADTPRTDMVDVSNHNGAMTAPEWTDMRNTYGVKAMVTKISEGTTYHDWTAKGNIASAQQAGIYVNGYHYLHATTVAGAITEADYAVAMAKPAKVSAIDQFKNAGDRFTAYGTFRVDKIAYVNGIWQAINYDMAGGKDADWTSNGIPLVILDNVTRGNVAPTKVGDTVKFMAGYDNGTIDAYDGASNGAGIIEGNYGMVWYNAGELLKK